MTNQAQTKQGGSAITFLVVGILLVGVIAGGILFLQRRNQVNPATPSVSPSASVSPSSQPSTSVSVSPTTKPTSSPSASVSPTTKPSSSASPKPSQTNVIPNESDLPSTGPADTLLHLVEIGVLTGVVVAYIRSRTSRYSSSTS